MWPAVGAIGSALLGGMFASSGQQSANVANAQQAQAQMDFQERMSSTAWQRGVADMKAAGLNPMLAYAQGGSSSPSGAQATMGNVGSAGVEGASTALGFAQGLAQLEKTQAETENVRAQTGAVPSEVTLRTSSAAKAAEEARVATAQYEEVWARVHYLESQEKLTVAQRAEKEQLVAKLNPLRMKMMQAQTSQIEVEKQLKSYELPSGKFRSDIWTQLNSSKEPASDIVNKIKREIVDRFAAGINWSASNVHH